MTTAPLPETMILTGPLAFLSLITEEIVAWLPALSPLTATTIEAGDAPVPAVINPPLPLERVKQALLPAPLLRTKTPPWSLNVMVPPAATCSVVVAVPLLLPAWATEIVLTVVP